MQGAASINPGMEKTEDKNRGRILLSTMAMAKMPEKSSIDCPTRELRKNRIKIPPRTSSRTVKRQHSKPLSTGVHNHKQRRSVDGTRQGVDQRAGSDEHYAEVSLEGGIHSHSVWVPRCCECNKVNESLREDLNKLKADLEAQTRDYNEGVRGLIDDLDLKQTRIDELTNLCNELFSESGIRQTSAPLEDEEIVVKKFAALDAATRNWCLTTFDLWPRDEKIRFSLFPLAADTNMTSIVIRDSRIFIACIWEWLLYAVFGHVPEASNYPLDLWTDEKTARRMEALERRVRNLQDAKTSREWMSFTVQCLSDAVTRPDPSRIEDFVNDVTDWIEAMLPASSRMSPDIGVAMQKFRSNVANPAIALSHTLRKRYTPVIITTPMTVESAIQTWRKRIEKNESSEVDLELELVTSPELRRLDIASLNSESPASSVILPACRQFLSTRGE